jgi:enoyl-CoA hydratase/carnithine racemase
LAAKRYGSGDAITAGLVDVECPLEKLHETAQKLAEAGLAEKLRLANFNPQAFSQVKIELYTDAYRALTMGSSSSPSHSRL